jgi:hypothetical protein
MIEIQEIKTELKRIAKIFEEDKLNATAKLVDKLVDSIPEKLEILKDKYLEILKTFQNEYTTNSFRKELFDHIVDMIVSSVLSMKGKLKDKLLELYPLFESIKQTAENTATITRVFLRTQDIKERFFGSCLLYLLKVEGEFDDTIRLLYVLKIAEQGKDVSLTEVYNKSLWKIRKELNNIGVTDLLFKGWKDNHLRNAIAHARLAYNEKTMKMTFTDIDDSGKQVYKEDLNIAEFSDYALAIDEVNFVFLGMMMMLSIRDLIIASAR